MKTLRIKLPSKITKQPQTTLSAQQIKKAAQLTVREYGETLRLLAKE